MPLYATPARAVYGRLSASSALLAVLTGGVWNKPLSKDRTPTAFGSAGQQLPAAVIPDEGENADPFGPGAAFMGFPRVWFYADDDPNGNGRSAIEAATLIAKSDLSGWGYTTTLGTGVVIVDVGRFGVRADPGNPTRLVDYLRLQADGLWRQET